jgi:hypothetical protein
LALGVPGEVKVRVRVTSLGRGRNDIADSQNGGTDLNPVHDIGGASQDSEASSRWTFFTNHFLVLAAVAENPDLRVRDIATLVGITERATQAILSDLANDGYLERIRIGRRNRYKVRRNNHFRHPLVNGATIGEALDVVLANGRSAAVG